MACACVCTCVFVFEKNTLDGSGWNFAAGLRDGPDYACSGFGTEIASADGFWTLSFSFYVCVFVYSLINIFVLDKASRSVNTFPR